MQLNLTFEQQKKVKAIGITVGVHLLLLLFFLLYKYAPPVAAPEAPMGLEVNLGTSEDGYGTDQPEAIGSPADVAIPQTASASAAGHSSLDQEMILQDQGNNPAININEHKNNAHLNTNRNTHQAISTTATTANNNSATTRKPKYTYSGSSGTGLGNEAANNQQGSNEGIGTGTGDMGVPGGTPGAANYEGIPGGNGNMTILVENRYLVQRPEKETKFREEGKVVINVTVTREGKIINPRVVSASNAEIRAIALQKLSQTRFNVDSKALPEQFGSIIFNFKH